MSQIHHPNDKLFKAAFGKKLVTKDFLLGRLPSDILEKIDINSLKRESDSFVHEKLKAYYSDVVYKVKTQEGDGYLFFLLEHQTKPDELMPLRLLEYDIAIMRHDVEQQRKAKTGTPITLPIVYNFVIYGGKEEWKYPRRLIDAFRTPSFLYRMLEDDFCICLNADGDEKIMADGSAALAEIVLKEGYRKDYCKFLAKNPEIGRLLNDSIYSKSAIFYILDRDPHNVDEVLDKLVNLAPEKHTEIMTALQQIREEGLQMGIIRGKKEGMKKRNVEIAKQMLADKMPLKEVSKYTGLSIKELQEIAP